MKIPFSPPYIDEDVIKEVELFFLLLQKKDVEKLVKKRKRAEAEDTKVSIRNVRRSIIDKIKKLKDQGVSEDEIKTIEKEIETLTEKYIKEADLQLSVKEKEIMSI